MKKSITVWKQCKEDNTETEDVEKLTNDSSIDNVCIYRRKAEGSTALLTFFDGKLEKNGKYFNDKD